MLTDLHIRNLAIIDRLHIAFRPGFNVLTGETGAGKSIIIDAVALVLGGRAKPELVRTGEDEAVVEAVFDLAAHEDLRHSVAEAGFGDEPELLIKRVVNAAGRNRIFVNGSLAKLSQLQPLTTRLMNIYGQHEHQSLQRTETHLALLDRFAGLESDLTNYRRLFDEVRALRLELERLAVSEVERRQKLDLLTHQLREITAAAPKIGEDEELAGERLLLQNGERLTRAANNGYEAFYGGAGAVSERLDAVAAELEKLQNIDPMLGQLAEEVRGALYTVEDVAFKLREYAGRVAFDPDRQQELEKRLDVLAGLKRKFGGSIQAVLEFQAEAAKNMEELETSEGLRSELSSRLEDLRQQLLEQGQKISAVRREAAVRLKEAIEGELKDLVMEKARFEMQFFALDEPGSNGLERGEFYLAPNPGEEPKPLAWIASGGELSRIMLALRCAAPAGDEVRTLIFDEIDAGIGGVAASAVAGKLKEISRELQVLCITHLPQVAGFADYHYRVVKEEVAGRTVAEVIDLDGEARVAEMARMLGGAQITDRTLEHAREIIVQSGGHQS